MCKKSIKYIKESSVLCENNHCFNISKKGYVNLVKNNAKTIYDKKLFESRSKIYEYGIYDELSDSTTFSWHLNFKSIERPVIDQL